MTPPPSYEEVMSPENTEKYVFYTSGPAHTPSTSTELETEYEHISMPPDLGTVLTQAATTPTATVRL